MLPGWLLILAALGYVGLLFGVAWWGDRHADRLAVSRWRPVVYSLSQAVYCTGWAFYGTSAQTASTGWPFAPTYFGSILLLVFGGHFLAKLITISKSQNITSLADFIASRYGKRQSLAVLVTLIAFAATVPYIALQLKALASSYAALTHGPTQPGAEAPPVGHDSALYIALLIAVFAMLFGTRRLDTTEHHSGMMLAIAFESVVKLFAHLTVGSFVVFALFGGFGPLWQAAHADPAIRAVLEQHRGFQYAAHSLLGVTALFCLPSQFHVSTVEAGTPRELKTARWLFPVYLFLANLFILPLALAGLLKLGSATPPDLYVLALPLNSDAPGFALLAFIGGLSASTSMVIVASVVVATMLCNDVVVPALISRARRRGEDNPDFSRLLLPLRRGLILGVALVSFGFYRLVAEGAELANLGLLAFTLVAQFAPALIGGCYWTRGHRRGALAGLGAGVVLWAYTLLLPAMIRAGLVSQELLRDGPFGLAWLRPHALFGLDSLDPVGHGLLWSLFANILAYVLVSRRASASLTDRLQAAAHVAIEPPGWRTDEIRPIVSTGAEVVALVERFLGRSSTARAFARLQESPGWQNRPASQAVVELAERLLAGVIGGASARDVLLAALHDDAGHLERTVAIVEETSRVVQFNRELLQAALDNASHGISVVDGDLRVVAWNRRYLDMFNYPEGFIYIGRPIAEVIRFNAERGECGPGDIEEQVSRRLQHLRRGTPHVFERVRGNGMVVQMRGNPIPGGGFVTSFIDITDLRHQEQALREVNEQLEQRVATRTAELSRANAELASAKVLAEDASRSKTTFLAAASHDLKQPLNAAMLFLASARERSTQMDVRQSLKHAEDALAGTDALISTLLDIAKLDAGAIRPRREAVALRPLLEELAVEFELFAEHKRLDLRVHGRDCHVDSDPAMLRRILQNLLSNALRYTRNGGVLLGLRLSPSRQRLRLLVCDTGPGIPEGEQARIFREFERLEHPQARDNKRQEAGHGLGLAIVQRLARVLEMPLRLRSRLGHGSCFELELAVVEAPVEAPSRPLPMVNARLEGLTALCLDNEPAILDGLRSLLGHWGMRVLTASSRSEALEYLGDGEEPDVLLLDYHLDGGDDGLSVREALARALGRKLPAVLISADSGESLKQACADAGIALLSKPIRPLSLKALLCALSAEPGPVPELE